MGISAIVLKYIILLGIIFILALFIKDFALAGAAGLLSLFLSFGPKAGLNLIQQYSFPIGILFLMLFLLMPIASGKIMSESLLRLFVSPTGVGSIIAGFLVSYIGGKGSRSFIY